MNIRESEKIKDILKYPDIEKFRVYIDLDDTVVTVDEYYEDHIGRFKYLGTDAWFSFVFTHATSMLNDNILLAFAFTTMINDDVQNFIHLKPVEKKTIDVINQLQAKNVPLMIVTARGFTLAKRTKEQLAEAKININHSKLETHSQKEPIEIALDYNFYCMPKLPDNMHQLGYKFSYVYIEESKQLFYFNRFKRIEEIKIDNPQFKATVDEILKNKKHPKLSKEELIFLVGHHYQPEKHFVVLDENILYCEGQDKGEAIEKFKALANRNKTSDSDEEYVLMVDDKLKNICDVEAVHTRLEKKFFGMHYKHIKENFDLEVAREELKNLYPHLPVKIRSAMVKIKLSENAMSFFGRAKAMDKPVEQEQLNSDELKTRPSFCAKPSNRFIA